MSKNIFFVLALLMLGSASLMAQTGDPFGEVDDSTYSNTMTIVGYVRMNGEVLGNETVVAVYQGDEMRGKGHPKDFLDGEYTSLLMMSIYGETKEQPLHFKVYTEGRVIEVDQHLTYLTDARIGKLSDPYYIDIPAPIVTTPLAEGWATTCVPFNAKVPEGVTVWNPTGIENGCLVMAKVEGSILPANTPVLLQSEGMESYEWLARVADGDINTDGSILTGTLEPTEVAAFSVLTLGYANEGEQDIGFWLFNGTEIPANSAYITDFDAGEKGARLFPKDEPTGIFMDKNKEKGNVTDVNSGWHTINGIRLSGEPLIRGCYVKDGKKVVIK